MWAARRPGRAGRALLKIVWHRMFWLEPGPGIGVNCLLFVVMRFQSKHLWLLAIGALISCQPTSDLKSSRAREDVRLEAEARTIQSVVPQNATLESLLRQQEVPAEVAASLVEAVRGVFNPRELRADRTYWVTRTLDGLFREFRYQINDDDLLRVVFRDSPETTTAAFDVEVVAMPKQYELAAASAQISRETNSLFAAFDASGENMQLPLQLAEIFSGQIDFNSDLHPGDNVEVLFDRATRDGEFVGYGDIRAALLKNAGRRLTAFLHPGPDGKPAWYDDEGRSLRRPFLKSPLRFNPRVTSAFSKNRFHPVLGINRPHLGVDFGAPFGTAVYAVADGVVEFAGWSGEAGRMVKIRHGNGYETAYLHLSAYGPGISEGHRVQQWDVIGRVGQTGTATGPHLDYRIIKNGVYVNPMSAFSKMPAGDPIAAVDLPQFRIERDKALTDLAARLDSSVGLPSSSPSSSR